MNIFLQFRSMVSYRIWREWPGEKYETNFRYRFTIDSYMKLASGVHHTWKFSVPIIHLSIHDEEFWANLIVSRAKKKQKYFQSDRIGCKLVDSACFRNSDMLTKYEQPIVIARATTAFVFNFRIRWLFIQWKRILNFEILICCKQLLHRFHQD